ncbi:MAG: succinylglutamate desuccinylase, partial [Massilia sp.]|nr:succinylglutamate desuccinylase [Massilia sp.]
MTQARDLQFKSINYTGLGKGPRLIVTGAVHGNETCG